MNCGMVPISPDSARLRLEGYDPTLGLVVADRHIAYAASAMPEQAAPVSGSFRGTGAAASMAHQVELAIEQ